MMIQYTIRGGKPLEGAVTISGAKNAAVAILPAALLVDGVCQIDNIPDISDVRLLLQIVDAMGAQVRRLSPNSVEIDSRNVRSTVAPSALAQKIRASYYLIGALLGRFGRATVSLPGGCNFGSTRPIDQHVKGFEALGARVCVENGCVVAEAADDHLKANHIYLDVVSVGATMNIMMAAVLAQGQTVIENCAREPHIVDLANFLNSMGAKITGAGTNNIKIRGVSRLKGGSYSIIPDQIEAGTYMAAVAACGGNVLVKNIIPKHMDCITSKLKEMGLSIAEYDDSIRVEKTRPLKASKVKTAPYPGFPTDMQPQIGVCMVLAEGVSFISEGIYDTRFAYTAELCRMGAKIEVTGETAVFEGVEKLQGCTVCAHDLRAGAAMVIAGLAAEGTTTVEAAHYVERGYECIIEKFSALGADITRQEKQEVKTAESAG